MAPEEGGGKELKKGPWTAEEDQVLVEFVRKHGEGNWNNLRRKAGLMRCGKSCRLRWVNHLRSNLKKGSFTPKEESDIIKLQARYGNRWSLIALHLPGRTDNEIKNFWNTRLKRHIRLHLPLYPPEVIREHPHLRLHHHQQPKQPLQNQIQPSSSTSSLSSLHQANRNFNLIPSSTSSLHMENPNFNLIPSPSSSSHMENPTFNLIPSPSSSSHMENPNFNLIPSSTSSSHMKTNFNFIPSSSSSSHMKNPNFNLIPSSSPSSHMENPNFNLIPSSSPSSHMENPNFNLIPSSTSSSHMESPNFNFIPYSSSSSHTKKPNFIPSSSLSSLPQENFGSSSIPSSSSSSHDQTNRDINPIPTLSLINPIPSNQLLSTSYHPDTMSEFNSQSDNNGGVTLFPLPSQNLPLLSSPIPPLDQSQITPYGMNPMPTMDASCRDAFLYENFEIEIPSIQSSFQAITPTSSLTNGNDHIVVPSNGEEDNYNVAPELTPERNSGLLQDVVGQSIALLRSRPPSNENKQTKDDQSESKGRIMHDNDISIMNVPDSNVNLDSVLGSSRKGKTHVEDSSFGFSSIDIGVTSQAHVFEDLNMMNDDFLSWIDFQPTEPPQEPNQGSDDASTKLAINVFNGTMATTTENQQEKLATTPSESNHDWATKDVFSPVATIVDDESFWERGYII